MTTCTILRGDLGALLQWFAFARVHMCFVALRFDQQHPMATMSLAQLNIVALRNSKSKPSNFKEDNLGTAPSRTSSSLGCACSHADVAAKFWASRSIIFAFGNSPAKFEALTRIVIKQTAA
jgi:hypothetical protein